MAKCKALTGSAVKRLKDLLLSPVAGLFQLQHLAGIILAGPVETAGTEAGVLQSNTFSF